MDISKLQNAEQLSNEIGSKTSAAQLKELLTYIEAHDLKKTKGGNKELTYLMKQKSKFAINMLANYFLNSGFKLYKPTLKYSAFIVNKDNKTFHVMVKAKEMMLHHNSTGVETYVTDTIDNLQKNSTDNVLFIFVDNRVGEVYAQFYKNLLKPSTHPGDRWEYPHYQTFSNNNKGSFFNLDSFKTLFKLSSTQSFYLNAVTQPHVSLYPSASRLTEVKEAPLVVYDRKLSIFNVSYNNTTKSFTDEDTAYQYNRECWANFEQPIKKKLF